MTKSTSYPRVYEYGVIAKSLWSSFALICMIGAIWIPIYFATEFTGWAYYYVAVFCAFIAGCFAVCLASTLRSKLVLYEDRLEYFGAVATRRIKLHDIEKTGEWTKILGGFSIVLILKSGRPKRVTIYDFGKMDEVFEDWINSYPNECIEKQITEQEALNAAVDRNSAFGNSQDERFDSYNLHIHWVNRLKWVVIAISLTCAFAPAFYSIPYDLNLYILMGLPVLCLIAASLSQGRLAITEDDTSGRVSLFGMAYIPIAILLMLAIANLNLVDWLIPIAAATAAGLLITGLVIIVERRFRWQTTFWTIIICSFYAWSTGILLNERLDYEKPRIERVQIIDKRISSGTSPDHYLSLSPWGRFSNEEYEVTQELYKSVKSGGKVCIRIYPGALGWEYYYIRSCQTATKA